MAERDGPEREAAPVRSIRRGALVLPEVAAAPAWSPLSGPQVLRLPLEAGRPVVARMELVATAPVVRSYRFGSPPAAAATPPAAVAPGARARQRERPDDAATAGGLPRRARIAPPADVVKLEERFFYLLQPDLETTLRAGRLTFPRAPFPFQFEGMAFLLPRHGAVLADEMGLGKSMQAISSIRLLVRSGEARKVLVVCPKGLVSNWARELADWAPELVVAVIEGDPARRRWQWSLPDVPVKVANYEVLVRDQALVAELGLSFDLVVLDEAQRIKNADSQTNRAIRGLPRRRGWALTGTPIENGTDDLLGIFEFVAPGLLDRRMTPRALGSAVSDHILRRTKEKVLTDMPPRLNRDARIELGPEQRETYRRAEEEGVLRLSGLGAEATIQHVFELVLRLKQICNFDTATGESAKLDCLAAELEEVRASCRKALVFSQWVETLGRLRDKLARFGAVEYHGGMSTQARDEAIRRFRHDPRHSVLLLSYGAGAVGLNLQFSQYVFLFDRWWNPAVEDQAINRAHRIGAAGAVTVTRFLAHDTIEERIDEVLRRKRDLSDTVLAQAGTPSGGGLTAEEIFSLFALRPPVRSSAADARAA
ncbi:MAG: DEAD/DEAH box helicase [Planctomycetaceae bacterium]